MVRIMLRDKFLAGYQIVPSPKQQKCCMREALIKIVIKPDSHTQLATNLQRNPSIAVTLVEES